MRFAGWFGIVAGILVLGQWGLFISTGNVPQLEEASREIAFHLVAEIVMALTILGAGLGLVAKRRWALYVYPLGLGMVVYSVINSPGYFAQRDEWLLVAMFMALLALSAAALILLFRHRHGAG